MLTTLTSALHPILSVVMFEQLRELLQQMALAIATETVLLTETELTRGDKALPATRRFVVLASTSFSAVLVGTALPEEVSVSHLQTSHLQTYQVDLLFDGEAIATFLNSLEIEPESAIDIRRQQARLLLQPNDVKLQTEFTLRLMTALAIRPSSPAINQPSTELALRQLEQERLFNQVMTQMRQSLELPQILQTSVDQVCQLLQVDRLVIYQLNLAETSSPTAMPYPAVRLLPGGIVTYEARLTEAIPSILHLVENCDLTGAPQRMDSYRHGLILAVEDIETQYAATPCLLKFLRQAQVRAKLVAPIVVHDQVWGFLIAHHCYQPYQWQDNDRRFLHQIAEHLAVAVTQAQLYAQVQQQNQTLEHRIVEHTQDLQDALIVAQAANRAKSEFLSAMSHELRTPLTTVIGMSATLLRWSFGELSQRQRKYLQTIHDSGEHLLHLINDILDLSQFEAGKAVLTLSEFSLSRAARQSLRTIQEKAILEGVLLKLDLQIDSASDLDRFEGDFGRLQQILLNLLSNAVKFTPESGKVTLSVFADETTVIFQVKDTGIGISEQHLSYLFQKFHQLDASYHRQYEGAGVGLALTKQIVELHGGGITVDSVIGEGSVFTVRLPRMQRTSKGDVIRAIAPYPKPPGRIVLIESDEENAGIICDMLTAAGYQVIWLIDGSTAIEQIEILQPIVVISEAKSPNIDSDQIIHRLRQNPSTRQIKAIVLTNSNKVQKRYLAIGADECLLKPLHPEQILQRVIALTAGISS
jgi:two-component system, sensor histidine kinase and response regulator